ncbi:MAG TPA: spermidine synthase [Streptosporangiaceae bacterium]
MADSETILRTRGRSGEVVVRRARGAVELIVNGVFLMDSSRDGESERGLASSVLGACRLGEPACLVGGLGFGYTLAEILAVRPQARVTCVEIEPAVVACQRLVAAPCGIPAGLAEDPRVTIRTGDVLDWLSATAEHYDAILLDVDNGPSWLVRPENGRLYDDRGLWLLARALRPAGVLGIWSAQQEDDLADRLARTFGWVRTVTVPVARGNPDVIYLASGAGLAGAHLAQSGKPGAGRPIGSVVRSEPSARMMSSPCRPPKTM